MRRLTTRERVDRFITELGRTIRVPARVYFTGGDTAVLHGWRDSVRLWGEGARVGPP